MRLVLKTIILFYVSFIVLLNSGDTTIRTRINQPYYSDYVTNNPAIVSEIRFRESYDVVRSPAFEEIRQQRAAERTANLEWIKMVTMDYSPHSWYLLMKYDSLPLKSSAQALNGATVSSYKTAETFDYLRGRTKGDLLSAMEKNVHEITHAYFDQNVYRYLLDNNLGFNPDNANGYLYIDPDNTFFISFPLKAMFPSGRLASVIPSSSRTFRYDTYISGQTSTQSDGVIGLLNELQAYYCGSRYSYDVLDAYKTISASDAMALFEWVTHTQSTMSAFYEFDFFIKEYLLYMKRNFPDNFELLRSYLPFTKSYSMLLDKYNTLINSYLETIENEMDFINSTGDAEAVIKEGWLWVKTAGSHISNGTPVFSEDRDKLLPVLQGKRYRELENYFIVK